MGPLSRYLGPEMPDEELLWQDPIPALDHELINDSDIATLKSKVLASGLTVSEGELRSKMDELASIAREQIRAGD